MINTIHDKTAYLSYSVTKYVCGWLYNNVSVKSAYFCILFSVVSGVHLAWINDDIYRDIRPG